MINKHLFLLILYNIHIKSTQTTYITHINIAYINVCNVYIFNENACYFNYALNPFCTC